MVEYSIETIGLTKRYPSSAKKTRRGPSLKGVFDALFKRGSSITALDGVALKVKQGEVFGLLGPNGAGKTTLIKILCTLILHDEGEAYVNGFDVQKEPYQVLRNLQAVIGGGFDWRLTARKNLEFYGSLYGLSKQEAEKKIEVLLNFAGLRDRSSDMYQALSLGMKRKLILCRALLLDVPILLFDEPTRGLDPPTAVEIRKLLRSRLSQDEGKTIFLSTHNMWEAQEICDRIAIIDRGRIIACDSPDNIRRLVRPEKVYDIILLNPKSTETSQKMLEDLRKIDGVNNLVLGVSADGTVEKLTLHLDEKSNISSVLKVLNDYNIEIKSIDAKEPPLEEAFIALTGGSKD